MFLYIQYRQIRNLPLPHSIIVFLCYWTFRGAFRPSLTGRTSIWMSASITSGGILPLKNRLQINTATVKLIW